MAQLADGARSFGVLALALTPACESPPGVPAAPASVAGTQLAEPIVVTRRAMGVRFQIALVGADVLALSDLARQCFDEVDRLEAIFSRWTPGSEISRLNADERVGWVDVHPELAAAVEAALAMSAATGGAFDITVLPVIEAWGLDEHEPRVPDAELREALASRVGSHRLEVERDPPRLRRAAAGMKLDLDALAKGWAVKRVVERLVSAGITNAFVAGSSSTVAAIGAGPEGTGWPFEVAPGVTWHLVDRAVSTSGGAPDDPLLAGRPVGDIVDPRTGEPTTGEVWRAVFTGPEAGFADMASTSLIVLGMEAGARWFVSSSLDQQGCAALLLPAAGEPVLLGHAPALPAASAASAASAR